MGGKRLSGIRGSGTGASRASVEKSHRPVSDEIGVYFHCGKPDMSTQLDLSPVNTRALIHTHRLWQAGA
jgi:hypothetical protein